MTTSPVKAALAHMRSALASLDADGKKLAAIDKALATIPSDAGTGVSQSDFQTLSDKVDALRADFDELVTGLGAGAQLDAGTDLPDATVGEAYTGTVVLSGTPPLDYSIADGALPDGLSLAAGGAVTGTPTTEGSVTFAVQAHDANGNSVQDYFSIDVAAAPPAPVEEPAADAAAATEAPAPS